MSKILQEWDGTESDQRTTDIANALFETMNETYGAQTMSFVDGAKYLRLARLLELNLGHEHVLLTSVR